MMILNCTGRWLCVIMLTLQINSGLANAANQNQSSNGHLQPIVPPFRVNEKAGGALQESPWIATRGDIGYVIVWWDWRDGTAIMGQLIDSLGFAVGDNFVIADTLVNSIFTDGTKMRVDANTNGEFVVVWSAGIPHRERPNIVACKFGAGATMKGKPFLVTDDERGVNLSPDVHMNSDGSFVIVWHKLDRTSGLNSAWIRGYDSVGQPKSEPTLLAEPGEDLSISGTGYRDVFVLWEDSYGTSGFSFIGKYDSTLSRVWGPTQVSHHPGSFLECVVEAAESEDLAVSCIMHGRLSESGAKSYGSQTGAAFVFMLFDEDGMPKSDILLISDTPGTAGYPFKGSFDSIDGKSWLVVWPDRRSGTYEIWARIVDQSGKMVGPEIKISETSEANSAAVGAISNLGIIAWQDERRGQSDIYYRRFIADSVLVLDEAEIVNQDWDDAEQVDPMISVDHQGQVVIAWDDRRNDQLQIYAQRFDEDGAPVGKNFDTLPGAVWPRWHSVSLNPYGKILISYSEHCAFSDPLYTRMIDYHIPETDTTFHIAGTCDEGAVSPGVFIKKQSFVSLWSRSRQTYLREFDYQGVPLSDRIRVLLPGNLQTPWRWSLDIAGNSTGRFNVICADKDSLGYRLFAQRYDSDLAPYDTLLQLTESKSAGFPDAVSAMDAQGNIVMAWTQSTDDTANVWAAFLPWHEVSFIPVKINQVAGLSPSSVDIAMNGHGSTLVVWDFFDGQHWRIMGQSLREDGKHVGKNFEIVAEPRLANHNKPKIALNDDRLYLVWQDDREAEFREKYDVYAAILDFNELLVTSVDDLAETHMDFELFQNHPNPFNPSTSISYRTAVNSHVTLAIYNALGQEVMVLLDQNQPAGAHHVTWDGRDGRGQLMPSGIYICRLQAGSTAVARKLILIR